MAPASTAAGAATPALPVVLAGARGHGRRHLDNIRRLAREGLVRPAGICELTPLDDGELEGLGSPEQSADFAALLESTGARIAVVCTPIHTHTDLALTAAERGVHLLLEKPPAPSYAEFERMVKGVRAAGVACQIGFQSLGSHAVTAVRDLIADGAIGAVRGIGAAGAWSRDLAYWERAPWAGRRRLEGRDVVDGVLTNPLAHAVATALRIDGGDRAEDVAGIELELYRANAIESDDTSCVRLRTAHGDGTAGEITAAVTLCAERPGEPYVVVHGTGGRITFWYKQDRLLLERDGHAPETTEHARTDLLRNLVAHLTGGEELLVPPERTGAFMRLVEAVRTAPEPAPLPGGAWRTEPGTGNGTGAEGSARRIVTGIDELVAAGAEELALYSELSDGSGPRAPWAAAAARAGARAEGSRGMTVPRPETPEGTGNPEGTGTEAAGSVELRCAGRAVARYEYRPLLAGSQSPRPYLHPVRTLGGTAVTELRPADHVHHLGVSMAVPDVGGANFWGGRTFVRGRGPVELDNHGRQDHLGWIDLREDGFTEEVAWQRDGRRLLTERRTVTARALDADCWALDFTTELTNVCGEELSVGSPATNGRPGAGYGGFFWRPPVGPRPPEVFTGDAEGEEAVHGSRAPWLAMVTDAWTLVFAGATEDTRRDRWFVRAAEYPGVGSALAWDGRLPLPAGRTVVRRVVTGVADGRLERTAAAGVAARLTGKEGPR